jgi:hypothetical protein
MQNKGILLLATGILGGAFIMSYDVIMRKPVNDFTGPVSSPALFLCGILIIVGLVLIFNRKPAPKKPS